MDQSNSLTFTDWRLPLVAERVDVDWRWRGNFEELEVLPALPSYEPDPRAHPEDYKNWKKLKFEYQRRLAQERTAMSAAAGATDDGVETWRATTRKKKRKCLVCKVKPTAWKFCTECGAETCKDCSAPAWLNAIWPQEFTSEAGPRLLCTECKESLKNRKHRKKKQGAVGGTMRRRPTASSLTMHRAAPPPAPASSQAQNIQAAIQGLENQRELLGDEVVDASLEPLVDQLAAQAGAGVAAANGNIRASSGELAVPSDLPPAPATPGAHNNLAAPVREVSVDVAAEAMEYKVSDEQIDKGAKFFFAQSASFSVGNGEQGVPCWQIQAGC